jgi:hypothetical protein
MGFEASLTLTLAGVMSAVSVFILLCFFDIRKVVGYHVFIDVVFSILMVIVYAGTFSGMITAFTGGLTLTALLWTTKWLIGYARWYKEWGWRYFPGVW